jgi:hypothetical protein
VLSVFFCIGISSVISRPLPVHIAGFSDQQTVDLETYRNDRRSAD